MASELVDHEQQHRPQRRLGPFRPKAWAIGGVLTLSGAAKAQASDATAAGIAQALFEQARVEIRHGDYQAACPKLEESERIDPANGTLLNLVVCEERIGKVVAAYLYAEELLQRLPAHDERRPFIQRRLDMLTPRLSRVTLHFATTWSPGAKVLLDGVEVNTASSGIPLLVEPGVHHLRVTAKGWEPRDYELSLTEGQTLDWRADDFESGAAAPIAPGSPSAKEPTPTAALPSPHPPPAPVHAATVGGPPAWVGWTAGAVGVAGVITGVVTTALALDRQATVAEVCPHKVCRDQSGIDAAAEGKAFVVSGIVSFAVGATGLGVGIYSLMANRSATRAPEPQPVGMTLTFGGPF